MHKPLISVIIPTYKSRGGLCKSIDSVLAQSYTNLEVIVIDDNNPGTQERRSTELSMLQYANEDRVSYLKHEQNKNGAAARNTGIRASKGNYIAFLDDDDRWLPEKLQRELDYLESHIEYDAVYTYILSCGVQSRTVPYEGNAIIPLLLNRTRMFTSSLLMTRKSVEAIGGFDESFRRHQDYELLVKFFKAGFKIGCLREPLTEYMPMGGNSPKGQELVKLKEQYLNTFSGLLDEIEQQQPGIKNKVVASNYALCFYTFIASRQYGLAWNMFRKWFWKSPSAFISQIIFLLEGKMYRLKKHQK